MREKVIELMGLMLAPFDKTIEGIVGQLNAQFVGAFGDLPPEVVEAVDAVAASFKSGRAHIESAVAEMYEANFTEDEVDAMLAFHKSPIGKKLAEISPKMQADIVERTSTWIEKSMSTCEPRLQQLLGAGAIAAVAEEKTAPVPAS
jgi:hypothetical protein